MKFSDEVKHNFRVSVPAGNGSSYDLFIMPYNYEGDTRYRSIFAVILDGVELFHLAKNDHDTWIRVSPWEQTKFNNFTKDQPEDGDMELEYEVGKAIEDHYE